MGDRPEGMTLERIDSNKGYSPDNVKWATNAEQQRNRKGVVRVVWNDCEWVLADLCAHLGIYSTHLYRNMKRGMSLLEAIQHLVKLKEKRDAKILAAEAQIPG
jgi:AraC-like DNA-binding protein